MSAAPASLPADPAAAERAARAVVGRLAQAGYLAYWAGGCVRDRLLGRTPVDYDVATNARPDSVAALFPGAPLTGRCFGVVRVRLHDQEIEVATFRADHAYHDGRHPEAVTFSDPVTDARRRDFTVNALFYDVVEDRIIDHVGGLPDLQARRLRAVGDPAERFREDHLRLLRAARFAAVLDFEIEPVTAAAVRAHAPLLASVAPERVREELTRLWLEAPRAGQGLRLLEDLRLLPVALPEVAALKGVEQPPDFHPEGDVFTHTALMLDGMRARSARLAWAVLLHDVGKPLTAAEKNGRLIFHGHAEQGADLAAGILQRLRFSTADTQAILAVVRGHMRMVDVQRMRRATLRRLVGNPYFDLELELHRLDCEASHGKLDHYTFLREFRDAMRQEPVLPEPWVSGRDLLELGVPQGPDVGHWKQQAYDAQLEGRFEDRDALLDWLRRSFPHRTG
jgi:poly(A) polymerase